MFGAGIEVVFRFGSEVVFDRSAMKSSTKKKLGPRNDMSEPNKTNPKKQYRSPGFEVLTPDQAKQRLTEGALPGEAATEELLKAASRPVSSATGQQRSIPDGTKLRQIKSRKPDTRN
jgi:hypothetical protein